MQVHALAIVLLAFLLHFTHSLILPYVPRIDKTPDIQSHLKSVVDFTQMTLDEQRFANFKIHDADGNDMLDGCEIVQGMYNSYDQESLSETPILSDEQLQIYVDPVLKFSDKNNDGFIDYEEYSTLRNSSYKVCNHEK